LEDTFDGASIECIGGEAVNGFRWEGDDLAGTQQIAALATAA